MTISIETLNDMKNSIHSEQLKNDLLNYTKEGREIEIITHEGNTLHTIKNVNEFENFIIDFWG